MKQNEHKGIIESIRENDPQAIVSGDFSSVTSIVGSSEQAGSRALFVCMRGARKDGHDFAKAAYERGCRHFLCERRIELPADASVVIVKSVRASLHDLLMDFYSIGERDFVFVAVTGTKGKTTTSLLLTHILNRAGYPTACSSTLGFFDGAEWKENKNTTPDLFKIVPWLARIKEKGVRFVVVEASSAALAGGRLYGMKFRVGILTSFSKDHVGKEEHGSMAEYLCAKRSLFSSYGIDTAILPQGVLRGEYIVADAERVIALESDEAVIADVEERENGQSFFYLGQRVVLSLIGAHNRTNARLALSAAACLTNMNEKQFFPYLSDASIPGRYEQILHKGIQVVIDYAHNYESFVAVAKAAALRTKGRMLCVFGSVGGRGEGRRAALARAASTWMDFSVITADDPGEERALGICAQIYAAFSDKEKARIVVDRATAIRYAFSLCRAGDTLLLLGKGHERVQRIQGDCIPFSERSIVLSL